MTFICRRRALKRQLLRAIQIAQEEDGPQGYLPMLSEDLRVMEGLMKAKTYGELGRIFAEPMFGRLAAARKKEIDPEKKELAAALRNQVKDGIKKIKALYFFADPKDIFPTWRRRTARLWFRSVWPGIFRPVPGGEGREKSGGF